jgi:hypothetical protein
MKYQILSHINPVAFSQLIIRCSLHSLSYQLFLSVSNSLWLRWVCILLSREFPLPTQSDWVTCSRFHRWVQPSAVTPPCSLTATPCYTQPTCTPQHTLTCTRRNRSSWHLVRVTSVNLHRAWSWKKHLAKWWPCSANSMHVCLKSVSSTMKVTTDKL